MDILFVLVIVAFFVVLSTLVVRGCELLVDGPERTSPDEDESR